MVGIRIYQTAARGFASFGPGVKLKVGRDQIPISFSLDQAMEEEQIVQVQTRLGIEDIHVLRSGSGPRRFLVWHSFDSVNRLYPWRYLEKYGEVIRVGLPGHGPIARKGWDHYDKWTPEHFVEIGANVCKRYFSGVPLTLVGHSAGAHIALGAALRLQGVVENLVLINPLLCSPVSGFTSFLARRRLWKLIGPMVLAPGIRRKQRSVDSFLEGLRLIVGDSDSFYKNPNTRSYVETGHKDYCHSDITALVNAAKICAICDLRPALSGSQLRTPILLVHGERDRKVPISQSEWIAQCLPHATFVRLSGVGHVGYGEREHEFENILTSWLDNQKTNRPHVPFAST